eukprot:TRINITY_DN5935_c0_g1_i1.p3 TRINITY_DN5935_c0_g1~~TRINITY_DN5935_c0_g1_i1.p3  ORF type:complete len:188 (+),score=67.62 TRINITY_DN5935_c0_g1_i1:78-566(+)
MLAGAEGPPAAPEAAAERAAREAELAAHRHVVRALAMGGYEGEAAALLEAVREQLRVPLRRHNAELAAADASASVQAAASRCRRLAAQPCSDADDERILPLGGDELAAPPQPPPADCALPAPLQPGPPREVHPAGAALLRAAAEGDSAARAAVFAELARGPA